MTENNSTMFKYTVRLSDGDYEGITKSRLRLRWLRFIYGKSLVKVEEIG